MQSSWNVAAVLAWWNGAKKWRLKNAGLTVTRFTGAGLSPALATRMRVSSLLAWLRARMAPTGPAASLPEMLQAIFFTRRFTVPDLRLNPISISRDDDLTLSDLYTAPVCRCAPPDNKPTSQEMANCQPYLLHEIELIRPKVIVALGRIAFTSILGLFNPVENLQDETPIVFSHNAVYHLRSSQYFTQPYSFWLVCSYHPSRQNTQTGRLTIEMFDQVWETVRELLEK